VLNQLERTRENMSLLTIGGSQNKDPFTDITNGNETPRTHGHKTWVKNETMANAPKKVNEHESPPHLSTIGRKLQFEDENSLQSIHPKGSTWKSTNERSPPNDIYDRSKCLRKKYQKKEQVLSSISLNSDLFLLGFKFNPTKENSTPVWIKYHRRLSRSFEQIQFTCP
jgi:hypothetical protein